MPTIDQGGRVTPHESQPSSSDNSDTCTARRHGDANAYNAGCRCPEARAAATRRRTRHTMRRIEGQEARVDATGTHRRIQALIAHGWPRRTLAARLGITVTALDTYGRRTRVLATTARRVANLYDELADHPGPSSKAREQAHARGWLPPLWWDDDTIDDPTYQPSTVEAARPGKGDVDPVRVLRAAGGEPVALTRAERLTVVAQLRGHGLTYDAIASRLHVSPRQIHRDLTDITADGQAGAA